MTEAADVCADLSCGRTAEKRLEIIARIVRERGFYALGRSDAIAIEAVLARLADVGVEPAPDDEFVHLVRAFALAGWRLERA